MHNEFSATQKFSIKLHQTTLFLSGSLLLDVCCLHLCTLPHMRCIKLQLVHLVSAAHLLADGNTRLTITLCSTFNMHYHFDGVPHWLGNLLQRICSKIRCAQEGNAPLVVMATSEWIHFVGLLRLRASPLNKLLKALSHPWHVCK